jgi:hypothetical protein
MWMEGSICGLYNLTQREEIHHKKRKEDTKPTNICVIFVSSFALFVVNFFSFKR